ncbi:MAG: RtcB family protein, partial [Ignavibacteriales bacterium]|nr:RtcB family protein [Ignavibacteriales bacterium]
MHVLNTQKLPIKLWLKDIEPAALEQAKHLAELPFAFRHIAIMPDSHVGYGMPIGGVLATRDVVIPNAVGVDIGCGMCAVKTSLQELPKDYLKEILGEIRRTIPVGFTHHKTKQDENRMPALDVKQKSAIVEREYYNALFQIGTLGGGNHFIELQKGPDGFIWVMIHSGSRNFGKQVADHYNKLAIELNEKWHSTVPKTWQLAFLPLDSEPGQAYLREMQYCVDFAFANRKLMMETILNQCIPSIFNAKGISFSCEPMINIAHNYSQMENHFHEDVMVHRKGATLARNDTIGIIPGSQGSSSFIVRGKGNSESFNSCSHGAGRKMGRNQAEKSLNLKQEIDNLNAAGVLHAVKGPKDLDEAPGAYKNIEEVME